VGLGNRLELVSRLCLLLSELLLQVRVVDHFFGVRMDIGVRVDRAGSEAIGRFVVGVGLVPDTRVGIEGLGLRDGWLLFTKKINYQLHYQRTRI